MGAVVIIGKDENGIMGDAEHKLAASAATLLGNKWKYSTKKDLCQA